jgi:hypothetical protein
MTIVPSFKRIFVLNQKSLMGYTCTQGSIFSRFDRKVCEKKISVLDLDIRQYSESVTASSTYILGVTVV